MFQSRIIIGDYSYAGFRLWQFRFFWNRAKHWRVIELIGKVSIVISRRQSIDMLTYDWIDNTTEIIVLLLELTDWFYFPCAKQENIFRVPNRQYNILLLQLDCLYMLIAIDVIIIIWATPWTRRTHYFNQEKNIVLVFVLFLFLYFHCMLLKYILCDKL